MSIFLHTERARPESYTIDFPHKEHKFNYSDLKTSVRSNLVDKFAQFDKLMQESNQDTSKTYIRKNSEGLLTRFKKQESPSRPNAQKTIDTLFGGPQAAKYGQITTSPHKVGGLANKFSSMGSQRNYDNSFNDLFGGSSKTTTSTTQSASFYHTFLAPQDSTSSILKLQQNGPYQKDYNANPATSSSSSYLPASKATYANYSQNSQNNQKSSLSLSSNNLSNSVPIQKLIELQNYLELTPPSELAQLPSNYQNELLRVAKSIARALNHHHNQQRKK